MKKNIYVQPQILIFDMQPGRIMDMSSGGNVGGSDNGADDGFTELSHKRNAGIWQESK